MSMNNPIVLRLTPKQDLKIELDNLVKNLNLEAAYIITCVGSLERANLRFASRSDGTELIGKFEIVALSGVMSLHGSHYHIAISDDLGKTIGGHLLPGCLIYTTAEIVIGTITDRVFNRVLDPNTGYKELLIEPK